MGGRGAGERRERGGRGAGEGRERGGSKQATDKSRWRVMMSAVWTSRLLSPMHELARCECLKRHAAHQILMAPLPERAPSSLSASGMLLIVPHGADAPPAPRRLISPLPLHRLCSLFRCTLHNSSPNECITIRLQGRVQ